MSWNLRGIDVAYPYQGDAYDVNGKTFVFVKATQGNYYVNPHMNMQIRWGEDHGLIVGMYHFMDPTVDVESQISFFKKHVVAKPGYPLAVDWEKYQSIWPSCNMKDRMIKGLMEAYTLNRVLLYTNLDGWLNHDNTSFAGDGLWIANPGQVGKTGIQHPALFHQYSIIGNVDQDAANFETVEDLRKWLLKGAIHVGGHQINPQNEPGFETWSYKNPPNGPVGSDAWGKLNDTQNRVKSLEKKMDA
jgi:GH25 family lysozyme M1 (1,4-beta-N-acetylmuramidase)